MHHFTKFLHAIDTRKARVFINACSFSLMATKNVRVIDKTVNSTQTVHLAFY